MTLASRWPIAGLLAIHGNAVVVWARCHLNFFCRCFAPSSPRHWNVSRLTLNGLAVPATGSQTTQAGYNTVSRPFSMTSRKCAFDHELNTSILFTNKTWKLHLISGQKKRFDHKQNASKPGHRQNMGAAVMRICVCDSDRVHISCVLYYHADNFKVEGRSYIPDRGNIRT